MNNCISRRTIARVLLVTTAFSALFSASANAQQYQPEKFRQVDDNGVDLTWGDYLMNFLEGSIGSGEAELALVRNGPRRDGAYDSGNNNLNWDRIWLTYVAWPTSTTGTHINVNIGSTFEDFSGPGTLPSGSSLAGGGSSYSYRTSDGTMITFADPTASSASSSNYCNGTQSQCTLLPVSITTPQGRSTNITWDVNTYYLTTGGGGTICGPDDPNCVGGGSNTTVSYDTRIREISNSSGYRVAFTYASNAGSSTSPSDESWHKRTRADFFNDLRSSSPVGSITYAYPATGVTQVTDMGGRVWQVAGTGDRVTGIRRPGSASDTTTINYDSGTGLVSSVTREGVTTNYSRLVSGSAATMTVTNALSQQTMVTSDLGIGRPTSVTDALNHVTSYQYDANGRLTRTTLPEYNATKLTYDDRGNVTETRQIAKPGSGLADIVASATFDATCSNPLTCNQPNTTTDAKGNVTNYTYDTTHGGVLTVTAPAPIAGGIRPQTRYTYEPTAPYRLTDISQCQSTASCAGAADEVRTSFTYDANSNTATVTKRSGNSSVLSTNTMTYTIYGDLETVDGPLTGAADTTKYRYSNARELVGVTEPDPDGAGPLKMRATRKTYTNALLTKLELGTVNSLTDADWGAFSPAQAVDIGYDGNARVITQKLSASGTDYAQSQFSYDALGRSDCTAMRMNTAVYASLPASACSLGTQGVFGADRISKTIYDAAGHVTQQKVALGTADEAIERTLTYSNNGVATTIVDAENNLTRSVLDGFDRPSTIYYPNPTKGSNATNPTNATNASDFQQLTYDANSNIATFRSRKGDLFSFTYDNLNRMTLKVTPGSESNVAYSYDLLGRQLSTTFQLKGISGPIQSVTNTYDAFGRQTSSTSNMDGVNRTMTSQYDPAGNRTGLSGPGGYYAGYNYDLLGNMTAYQGQVQIAFDSLGRRVSMGMGSTSTSSVTYSYDGVSRLSSMSHDLAGTSADHALGFNYNPASQIVSRSGSNDSYAYTGSQSVNRAYVSNGLNQYTTVGPNSVTYDPNGNVISDGSDNFTYDSENRLISVSGAHTASLSYDPLGRLWQISSGSTVTRFIYDGDHDVIETDGSGNILRGFDFGQGADEPLVWWENGPHLLHADQQGSIVSIADSNGNVTATNSYDEYGTPGSANQGRFQYTGQVWLPEVGLYYYKARMYSPQAGRFLQTDPIGYGDGPNWYAYVHNDPINNIDPMGLEADCGGLVVCGRRQRDATPNNPPLPGLGNRDNGLTSPGERAAGGDEIIVTGHRRTKPTGKAPFYFNGVSWVSDPLYRNCLGNALWKNKGALALDAASLALLVVAPEASAAVAVAGATLATAGMINSSMSKSVPGFVGAAIGKESAIASGLFAIGSNGARAAKFAGWGSFGLSALDDVASVYQSYKQCH